MCLLYGDFHHETTTQVQCEVKAERRAWEKYTSSVGMVSKLRRN